MHEADEENDDDDDDDDGGRYCFYQSFVCVGCVIALALSCVAVAASGERVCVLCDRFVCVSMCPVS